MAPPFRSLCYDFFTLKSKTLHARAVLFDWDGTLLNSYVADSRAYLAMFRALGISWTMREVDRHYSPNWHLVYKAARIKRADWARADRLWAQAYRSERPRLLGGARDVLRRLERHFVLGLVTSGNRKRVRRQLREFELAGHFSTCVCCEDAPKRKPHPAPLELAMERMGAEPRDCLYVGDSAEDVMMAQRAGVHAVGVIGPFPTAKRMRAARPAAILRTIRDLPEYARRWASG